MAFAKRSGSRHRGYEFVNGMQRDVLDRVAGTVLPLGARRNLPQNAWAMRRSVCGLFGASPQAGTDSVAFERFRDAARDLGTSSTVGLPFSLVDVGGAGDRAGISPFVLDADFAFDGGR